MLDVGKLATLCEVVERRSFSAAAVALNLTQPAVSRQISVLEAQVATQLVRRSRRGVVPTEAGALLVRHAEGILGRLRTAEDELASLAGLQAGRVRIGLFFTAFAVLAAEIEALAEQRLPRLEISYVLADRATAFQQLDAAELDLAVVFEHDFEPSPPPPGLVAEPLFDDPAQVLLPARHALAARESVALAELDGERWIRPRAGSAARLFDQLVTAPRDTLEAGAGDEPVETQVHVGAGSGIALAHELNVVLNPATIAVRPLTDAPPRRIQLAHADARLPPAAHAVAELVKGLRG
jgi:DNA-binding transcriptional LysR family regulator